LPQDVAAPPRTRALVRLEGVHKSYDGIPVVQDLSLDVAQGELLTLLGPSGSGKTTALMMLAGFAQPSAGRILIDGADVTGLAPERRGIGVVFQGYALFPHMTVAENVAFPLAVRHVGRAERARRVAAALDMVRLPGFADRRPAQLSGGQQQRVALARALVFAPKLVLLDEPLGALDRALREEMQGEIRALHDRLGMTMVHVTHDQDEALSLSDRIAVLHHGVLRQVATPRELYEEPADAFVAGFVGDNNRLAGTVGTMEDDLATIRLDCGALVRARPVDARPGERCIVAIRPERVAVLPADAVTVGEGSLGEAAVPARLIEALYLGDHLRLRLSLGNECEIVVKRPAAAGLGALAAGVDAAVAWQPYHALAFRPEA
jgi:putative spermidine/putrescine transport system ATP-binding protein